MLPRPIAWHVSSFPLAYDQDRWKRSQMCAPSGSRKWIFGHVSWFPSARGGEAALFGRCPAPPTAGTGTSSGRACNCHMKSGQLMRVLRHFSPVFWASSLHRLPRGLIYFLTELTVRCRSCPENEDRREIERGILRRVDVNSSPASPGQAESHEATFLQEIASYSFAWTIQ